MGGVAGEVKLILLILRLENSPRPPTPPPITFLMVRPLAKATHLNMRKCKVTR